MLVQFEKLRKYGEEQVSYLMAFGYQKLGVVLDNPYGQALSKIVNSAVDLTNKMVDYYLPASEEEMKESSSQEETTDDNEESSDPNTLGNVAKKVGALSYKMRRRVMSQNLSKIVNSAMDLTNKTVDYYLPPLEEEIKEGEEEKKQSGDSENSKAVDLNVIQNVVKQVGVLSTKMRRRVFSKVKVLWVR